MSKYDVPLDIINQALYQPDNSVIFKYNGLIELKEALEQAQRQEKLLELYKEYFEYSEMLKDGRKFGGRMLVEHERDKIIEEIKGKENE